MLLELNDQIKQGNLQVDISKEVDQNATLRARSSKGAELASVLKAAVEGIDKHIPKDQPIVLLGRDNWQLLPLLKEQGRPVQYFLWSRLQNSDAKTKAQWLKEVPPNAAVVDTGYSGSIIDWIRKIDAGAKGYLLERRTLPTTTLQLDGIERKQDRILPEIGRSGQDIHRKWWRRIKIERSRLRRASGTKGCYAQMARAKS